MADEETILAALAALMAEVEYTDPYTSTTGNQFVSTSRRVKLWTEVPHQQQPACFQAEHANGENQTSGMPYKAILEANWIIYHAFSMAKNVEGARYNTAILKGVRTALAPLPSDPGYYERRNTLGGLVYHCYIGGRVFKDPGDIDGEAMMVVPIKLLVPSLS
jgi:hypothetical protein